MSLPSEVMSMYEKLWEDSIGEALENVKVDFKSDWMKVELLAEEIYDKKVEELE